MINQKSRVELLFGKESSEYFKHKQRQIRFRSVKEKETTFIVAADVSEYVNGPVGQSICFGLAKGILERRACQHMKGQLETSL